MPEQKGKPPAEDFVSKIIKDPAQPPDVLLLMGYLGASSEEGYTRLYFDAQLSNYVEIPDAAILHTQKTPAGQSALGESYVWIDKNAEIIHGKVGPNRPKAKFLEGPIFQDFMRGAQFGEAAAPQPALQATLLGSPTCAPELCLRPSIVQACPPPQPTQLGSPTCAPELCLRPSIFQACPPPQPTQLGSPTCAPELCLRPSIVQFCPTPSAVQLCPSQVPVLCAPSVAVPCLTQAPAQCFPPSLVQLCAPSLAVPCLPNISIACPPTGACPASEACQPPIAQGGGAMAQQVQPFAGGAPQAALPPTQLFCPTHAPFFCPQTLPPVCPQLTPPQTQLFCPTHAPFFCPQTLPPVCPQLTPPQTQLFCPTQAPFFCPQTLPPVCLQVSLSPDCLPPWTPVVSIACGWGQQPGGPVQPGEGPAQPGEEPGQAGGGKG